MTLTLLKLPLHDSCPQSTAELLTHIEAEITCWATSKPILRARRLRKDGTSGIRLGDLADLHRHLANGADRLFPHDPSREARILNRANHTLDHDRDLWNSVLRI